MSRSLYVACLQPPLPGPHASRDETLKSGLALLREAGQRRADLTVLPELFNVVGLADRDWREAAGDGHLLGQVSSIAAQHGMYVAIPILERRGERLYNTTLLLGRDGTPQGRYDKTHLTAVERDELGVTPGNTYPAFDLDFGRVGVMTCYDGHFPEVGRLLALAGAEIVLFPALQRRLTAADVHLQVRARAVDNGLFIARASYGHRCDVAWVSGMPPGRSCIVDFEGTVLADAGPRVGWCGHTIDLDRPRPKERSYGGQVGDARRFMAQDRRPETYGALSGPP